MVLIFIAETLDSTIFPVLKMGTFGVCWEAFQRIIDGPGEAGAVLQTASLLREGFKKNKV